MAKFTCIESFCGAGGMAIGLKNAGYKIKSAFDLSEDAVSTYLTSIGKECFVGDASSLSAENILERANCRKGEVTLFTGGPPCQGFSKQRRGAHVFDDPRNKLIRNYISFVNSIQPSAFILENVAIFGQKRGKVYLDELASILSTYSLYPHFYNAADYGLAQTRQRFILVGIRNDYHLPYLKPEPTVKTWNTVRNAIGDLPEPPIDCSTHPKYFNHHRTRISPINLERFSHVPQGGGWKDIPFDLRLNCHKTTDPKSGGWPDVYGRLDWSKQSPTITGGFDSFTRGRYGHPEQNRAITPREAARLQGFPDYVHFQGTRSEVRYQIGNAVPPPLAEAIGTQIVRVVKNDESLRSEAEFQGYAQEALF